MENTMEKFKGVKIVFQRPDGLWPIEGKLLTDEEFEKLRAISECQWQMILYPSDLRGYPEDPAKFINMSGLKEETLRKIADEKELYSHNVDDIIKNCHGERT